MSKESQLATFYTVDKRLCRGHVINGGVRDMIHAFDVKHYPVAKGSIGIHFTLHILRYHPGFTAIQQNRHTGGAK